MLNQNLKEKTDWELVKEVRNNASDGAFQEICRRCENLFYKVCQKYASALTYVGVYVQYIFDDKNIIILHCIKIFKRKKKCKLSSLVANYARFLCLNTI